MNNLLITVLRSYLNLNVKFLLLSMEQVSIVLVRLLSTTDVIQALKPYQSPYRGYALDISWNIVVYQAIESGYQMVPD